MIAALRELACTVTRPVIRPRISFRRRSRYQRPVCHQRGSRTARTSRAMMSDLLRGLFFSGKLIMVSDYSLRTPDRRSRMNVKYPVDPFLSSN